ncbi:hypothetical protein ACFLZ1_02895 [Patescibacteria group bacterium]
MLKKFTTIYKNTLPSSDKKNNNEERKVSYWLEKLHIQKEKKVKVEKAKNSLAKEVGKALKQEGKDKQTRNQATKKEVDRKRMNDLVQKSNRCIITISSLFPWDFFPNTVAVEESRVTFTFRQFLSSQSHSVEIKDISNVFIESSLFFASLQVVSRTYVQNNIKIGHLSKKKAQKVQMVIEGLRTIIERNINTSNYKIDELIAKIKEFQLKDS